jgi:hypothetical protein
MSKKKSNSLPVTSDQPVVSDEPLYQVKSWKGKAMYVCPLCGMDTFEKMTMLRHLVCKHNSELALVELVELEGKNPTPSALRASPQNSESTNAGEKKLGDVFEVELVGTGSAVDAQGNEHKTFTIKEQ